MKSLASLIGKRERNMLKNIDVEWVLPEQLMGIEVEVDRSPGDSSHSWIFPDTVAGWRRTSDGSLRNGVEYVLECPKAGKDLTTAILNLFQEGVFGRQTTSSTHVHLDMLEADTTSGMMQAMVLLVYATEDTIFALSDPGREFCGFTNKLNTVGEDLLAYVLQDNIDDDSGRALSNYSSAGRYYGLNLMSLVKYGSLEFRYFPTATSHQELIDWVQLVQSYKRAVFDLGSIEGVKHMLRSEDSYSEFVTTYFKQWAEWFFKVCPYKKVVKSTNTALAIANASKVEPVEMDYRKAYKNKKFSKLHKKVKVAKVAPTPVLEHGFDMNPATVQEAQVTLSRIVTAYTDTSDQDYRATLSSLHRRLNGTIHEFHDVASRLRAVRASVIGAASSNETYEEPEDAFDDNHDEEEDE